MNGDSDYVFTITYKGHSEKLSSSDEKSSFEVYVESVSTTNKFSNSPREVSFISKGGSSGTVSADEQIIVNVNGRA